MNSDKYPYIKSIYGGIEVDELWSKKEHSIEHIFPKKLIKDYFKNKEISDEIIKGATTNPLNFAAAHRKINSLRGHLPFDIEEDEVKRTVKIYCESNYDPWGIDHESEWVIPEISRGNVARAMLYMCLTYGIKELYQEHINAYRNWCKIDPPNLIELEYNEWVYEKHGIRNPFITSDVDEMLDLLNDKELLGSIMVENL